MASEYNKIPLHAKLRDPNFGIRYDVTFQIMDMGNKDLNVIGEIKGHKFLLGLYSPVFKKQFFGDAQDTEDTIPIKQTTRESSEKMIDFIYSKEIDWAALTVMELYDVVNLADKYDMPQLTEVAKIQLEKYPLTMENLMEVASTADEYQQFSNVTSTVLLSCAKFLNSSLQLRKDLLNFAAEQVSRGQEVTAIKLLALANELPESQVPCDNCSEVVSDCLDGQEVKTFDKVKPGCNLGPNKNCHFWHTTENRYFTVVSVDHRVVEVYDSHWYPTSLYHTSSGSHQNDDSMYGGKWKFDLIHEGTKMHIFRCK